VLRAVPDAKVYVSALIRSQEAPGQIIMRFLENSFEVVPREPKDVDLAVWLDGVTDLDALRKLTAQALNRLWQDKEMGVAHHQVDIFLLDGSGKYLGRLCHFNQCPKHKPQCRAEGCGRVPFLQQHDGFVLDPDALAPERLQILYGRL
jgi:hypothetical protein